MNTTLSAEQIEIYRRDGYIVQPDFLTPDELDQLRRAVDESLDAMGKFKVNDPELNWESGDSYYDKVFTQRINLWRINETVRSFMLSPELGRMLCDLTGVDGMRVWHDQALIKEPFANPTGWHLDDPYWSFYSRDAVSIWIALDDATLSNGCLYFIPGSHHLARFDNIGIGSDLGGLFDLYPEMLETPTVPVQIKAGSCSFHNGLCAHGAGANMTAGRRRAMTCAYMPDGSTFNGNPNILPDSYLRTLKVGDLLNDDARNPLIYRK
ncbi:MAG: phytanoyl-CoA dioxygenase family protein [Fimbriimonas sp.]